MINPKELRIGNIIEQGVITSVHETYAVIDLGWTCYDSKCVTFKPIPLTPEWLERFAFQVNKAYYTRDKVSLYCNFIRDGSGSYDGFCCALDNKKGVDDLDLCRHYVLIKHVHQLQNLYYTLTGTELTVQNLNIA